MVAACRSWSPPQTSTASQPAATAATHASGTGIRLVDQRPRHGSLGAAIAFLHPKDLAGVLTELVQAPPR